MIDTEIEIETEATLTCPECKKKQKVIMPAEGKQHFFKCANDRCDADIATKDDECCIFCSYSDKKCPAKQVNPHEDEKPNLQSLI